MQISKHFIKKHILDRPSSVQKPLHYSISSTGSLSPDYQITSPVLQICVCPSASGCITSFAHQMIDIRFLRPQRRLFSITSASKLPPPEKINKRHNVKGKQFSSKLTVKERALIVEAIKHDDGGSSLDWQLNKVAERLSVDCLSQIFSVLNGQRVSGLPMFIWVLNMKRDLYRNSNFCSLIIDNCGWLGDYETMSSILNDLKSKNLCLTSKAFSFLPVLNSTNSLLMESIAKLIQVLDKVGGSSRSSGIIGMIEMLCKSEAFEMADFVMNITERKPQYYKVVIREKCKKCHFQDARKTLEDMRHFLCEPDVNIYNYLLSSLCKNRKLAEALSVCEEMKNNGNHPNSLTFDIFIHFTAREGMLHAATEFLNEMINMGLEPRFSTHAVIIKGFLHSGRLEESKEYGIDSEVVEYHQRHRNMIYCLLACFHQQKGDILRARIILIKMMDKSLRPNLSVYRRVFNQLKNDGHEELARDLKNRFSSFTLESCVAVTAITT
ncbi:pentatricopeptide repeat-containing protein At3g04760, chloroplastic-like [Impatiens glandulifera]|uniref:pentatricopeptide repeat-containing protein At3g04760, chloroplastic-like n=1 Tax=Impatiens glandulifera TaxID=253017 RepID=UPI001FB07755|nr:pentatricopeptide repeat-containing protein At3g04760, chloroplastic-like [Impatiens glandulifera]XP_047313484.1 pentatricopeptide repeat-containing protein At3g04760, chloroplastic-like [Impatiens glandulifera]